MIQGSPRLFISYRWSHAADHSGAIDFFVGALYNRGYDLVFDRDPRHLDKRLFAGDLLLLMYGCTHYVLLMTDELIEFLDRPVPAQKSQIHLELDLARSLVEAEKLQWMPIVLKGIHPSEELFPTRKFQVAATYDDGRIGAYEPVERRALRATIAEAQAAPGLKSIEVHDITWT